MITLLCNAAQCVDSQAEGLKLAADSKRAGYQSSLAAAAATPFIVKYPERILKASDTIAAWEDENQEYKWAPQLNSRDAFEGHFQNGTREQYRKDITAASRQYKRAIDHQYPRGGLRSANTVFTEMLGHASQQALVFIDSILPLADMLGSCGLTEAEAWDRTVMYLKSIFDSVRQVRVATVSIESNGGGHGVGIHADRHAHRRLCQVQLRRPP